MSVLSGSDISVVLGNETPERQARPPAAAPHMLELPHVGELERVLSALHGSGARYLVVGGVAVVLHGHPRFTADLDVVIALEPANLQAALSALSALGYRPRAPVPLADFIDEPTRRSWIVDKGLTVFSLWSPELPLTEIDLFVEEPFPFDEAYGRALRADLGFGAITVASIDDLIALKRRAGRAKDMEDIRVLQQLQGGASK